MTVDHCESCGKPSNRLAVLDSVLTCPECIDNKNVAFFAVLGEMLFDERIAEYQKECDRKKKQ